jgi:hypothetical protein
VETSRSWAEVELGQAQLRDVRRTRRLIKVAEQRLQQPDASLPESCGSWAATKALYRLMDNEALTPGVILDSHREAVLQRARGVAVVLCPQDTTYVDYTHHPNTAGLGVMQDEQHQGLLVHTTLALTPERVPLGILDQQVWTREAETLGKRHDRRTKPTVEKESQKWLQSVQMVAGLQARCPEVRWVSVADREADLYDFLHEAHRLKVELVVRAAWDRRVAHPEAHLWACVERLPIKGTLTVSVPRRPDRPAREAQLSVRFTPVNLRPPRHRAAEQLPLLTVWAILVREDLPPAGVEAIEWLLLTTCPTPTWVEACERVEWYAARWLIEVYHKILKSGCRIEARQFEQAARLKRYVAVDSVVAWQGLYLTMAGREMPNLPCTTILATDEWQALYCFIHQVSQPPITPPTLRDVTRWIAQLGGFLGRARDGQPGTTVLWRGLQRLHDIVVSWQLFHPKPLSKSVGKD